MDLCIYHGNCVDGFGAACVVHVVFPKAEFFPARYGRPPPDVKGRDVIIVDFSYDRETTEHLYKEANSLLILDHHKSAQEALRGLPYAIFDMERSGAIITWDYFFPNEVPPLLLRHIQDRDLWKFELAHTKEVMAALYSYPMEFEAWDPLKISELVVEGQTLLRKHNKDLEVLLEVTKRYATIGGFHVPIANVPFMFASDAGHELTKGFPFAATYYDTEHKRVFSLRSGEVDVSAIAVSYGGGGHYHAAGFEVSREHPLAKI